jgi:hypothetical protein
MLENRLNPRYDFGEHIPLSCRNHPDKRWSTKNIAPLGCRSIFYNLRAVAGMGPECKCPASDLIVVKEGLDVRP